MEDGVGSDELCFTSRFYRLRDDCVAVMVVEDHEVLAAATGVDGETDILVCGDFTSQFDCLNKNLMGSGWGACWLGRTRGAVTIEGLVKRMFCRSCLRCSFAVASNLGRCLRTSSEVRPVQVAKYPEFMALVQVCMTGLKAHRCRYWTSSALFFI